VDIGYLTGSCFLFHDAPTNLSMYIHFRHLAHFLHSFTTHFRITVYGKRGGVRVDLEGDLAAAMMTGLEEEPQHSFCICHFPYSLSMDRDVAAG